MIVNVDSGRIKRDHHGPGDQADGIEEIHDLKCHQACDQSEDEDPVTKPSEGSIVKGFGSLFFPEENTIEKIDRRPHGTEPATEEIAKDENQQKDSQGWQHPQDNLFLREERNDPDKRVEAKVEVYRNLQLKGKRRLNDQVEEKTEREGLDCPPQVRDRSVHVALTFFIRTFERSISPNPKS
jgi:hypothetical protein